MRLTRLVVMILAGMLMCSRCLAQHHKVDASLTAYGKKTKKYIAKMEDTAIEVVVKAGQLNKHFSLLNDADWKATIIAQLVSLSKASRQLESIKPVPSGLKQVNRDLAALGARMDSAARVYKKGVETSNRTAIATGAESVRNVYNTLDGLSAMRGD